MKKCVFLFFFLNKSIALFAAGNDYVITLLQTGFFQHSHSAEIIGRHCIGMGFVGTLVNKSHVFLQAENNLAWTCHRAVRRSSLVEGTSLKVCYNARKASRKTDK